MSSVSKEDKKVEIDESETLNASIPLRLNRKLKEQFKLGCAYYNMSMSRVLTNLIEDWVKQYGVKAISVKGRRPPDVSDGRVMRFMPKQQEEVEKGGEKKGAAGSKKVSNSRRK